MTKVQQEEKFVISKDDLQSKNTSTRYLEYTLNKNKMPGYYLLCLGTASIREDGQWEVILGKNYDEDGCEDEVIGVYPTVTEAEEKLWEARWLAKGYLNL